MKILILSVCLLFSCSKISFSQSADGLVNLYTFHKIGEKETYLSYLVKTDELKNSKRFYLDEVNGFNIYGFITELSSKQKTDTCLFIKSVDSIELRCSSYFIKSASELHYISGKAPPPVSNSSKPVYFILIHFKGFSSDDFLVTDLTGNTIQPLRTEIDKSENGNDLKSKLLAHRKRLEAERAAQP